MLKVHCNNHPLQRAISFASIYPQAGIDEMIIFILWRRLERVSSSKNIRPSCLQAETNFVHMNTRQVVFISKGKYSISIFQPLFFFRFVKSLTSKFAKSFLVPTSLCNFQHIETNSLAQGSALSNGNDVANGHVSANRKKLLKYTSAMARGGGGGGRAG